MNVQKINHVQNSHAQIMITNNRTAFQYTNYGIQLKQPMVADTISFKAKTAKVSKEIKAALARKEARRLRDLKQIAEAKNIPAKTHQTKKSLKGEERKQGISMSNAKQVREIILAPQKQIHNFMNRIFGDLKISSLSPKNILFDFSDRAKSALSIMEKSSTREWNSIKEVLSNMTDLNGAKIVMNYKTGKAETEAALDRLIPLIKTKQIKLHEIELQRPGSIKSYDSETDKEKFDYVTRAFLDKLEDAQEEVINGLETNADKIVLIDRPLPKYTNRNYCALHLILQLNEKNSRPFELQIMGARMAKGKPLDDEGYKYFEGKEIGKQYAKLIELWEPLKAEENKAAKEEFLRYWKEANLQLREDELKEYEIQRQINRPTGFFKTVREYKLPPEYDLNRLYSIMLACEKLNTSEKSEEKLKATLQELKKTPVRFTKDTIHKLLKKFSSKHTKDSNNIKLKQ